METRRKQYVTPLSYLELLSTYKTLLESKRENILNEKRRYETGLEQLAKAEDAVSVMQEKLEKIRPVLIETKKDAEDMMVLVQQETVFAMKIREGVEAEKSAAQGKADLANKIKEECDIELAKAMPAMQAAIRALENLKKDDITEMKSFKSPPGGKIKFFVYGCCFSSFLLFFLFYPPAFFSLSIVVINFCYCIIYCILYCILFLVQLHTIF